ncbi:hypothetical protein ABHF91_05190 [Pseudaeromonas sp. ZJS20]|uniref:hypothetical protein n=1 Tax=Pseudaeromonas aegiceratis TaxID=3153928 RepID=UPI00390C8ECC
MASFSWIQIDAVRYDWDGQQIGCHTEVGFVSQLSGSRLDGLEIEADGQILGHLDVDFSRGELHFEPVVQKDEVQGVTILYGQAGKAGQPLLLDGGEAQFPGDLQDLLAEESGPLLLWQSLAAEDQPRESVSQTEVLLAEDMLSDASPCLPELDLFHHQQHMAQDLAAILDGHVAPVVPLLDDLPPGLDF